MNLLEFSNTFDILYNNAMSNSSPGLNEYDKSIYLTKAQDEIVKNYFNRKGNKYQEGFDDSIKRQIDFSTIIKVAVPTLYSNTSYIKYDDRSIVYLMPSDILFLLSESVKVNNDKTLVVLPLNFEQYDRHMSKSYKQPLKNQCWRIYKKDINYYSEIILNPIYSISQYKIRYVKKPQPIILTNIGDEFNTSIDGISTESQCELDSIIHYEIIERAVELAKVGYKGEYKDIIELGQRAE